MGIPKYIEIKVIKQLLNYYKYQVTSITSQLSYPNTKQEGDKELLIELNKYKERVKILNNILEEGR